MTGYRPLTADIAILTAPRAPSVDSTVLAFTQHCRDGGADFIGYLFPGQKDRALEMINDAVQNYPPDRAIFMIKEKLGELFGFAAQAHRESLEWGVNA